MRDEADLAEALEAQFREAAIKAASFTPLAPSDFDGKHCYLCDAVIPEARLSLGKYLCVSCQTVKERKYGY